MVKRIGAGLISAALISGVAYLGWLSNQNSVYVWWFGLATALAAPIGLSLLTFSLKGSSSEVIQRLAKVPEIERLINDAKSREEKIRLLEIEHEKLVDIVKLESRRQAIADRVTLLESDASRILIELENLDQEQSALGIKIGNSNVSSEIARLRERVRARERGDLVIQLGNSFYQIDRSFLEALPFGKALVLPYINIIQKVITWTRRSGSA